MRLLICSDCGYRAEESEWLCVLRNGEVVRAYCPKCPMCTDVLPQGIETTSSEEDE